MNKVLKVKHFNEIRNSFNKALIRAFIKNSCSREAWNGAPWLVKERYARRFRIDTTVPEHLRQKDKVKPVPEKEDKRSSRKEGTFSKKRGTNSGG